MTDNQPGIYRVENDAEFDQVFRIRHQVFIEEMNLPEEMEYDGLDHISQHYLALWEGVPCGTARWRLGPHDTVIRFERLAVLPAFRNKGIGQALVKSMLSQVPQTTHIQVEALGAKVGLYEKWGFHSKGEPYEVAGWVHQEMHYTEHI